MSKSATSTDRYAKRGPVIMPVEPPYEILRWLAGDPVILAASDEQSLRKQYAEFRVRMQAANKEKRK